MTTLSAAAIELANQGFRVIPLEAKKPISDAWETEATTNVDAILNTWQKHPEANIGIVTGSGRFVLDVSGDQGQQSLDQLFAGRTDLVTVTARTGTGGHHLWFTGPDLPSRDDIPGIQIIAAGGQVVAPPSVHPVTGEAYAWNRAPGVVSIAEAPQWLLDALTSPWVSLPPEPPALGDMDAPPLAAVVPLRSVPTGEPNLPADGNAALQPAHEPGKLQILTKSYASAVQILRQDDTRVLITRPGKIEFNTQSLAPCIDRQPVEEWEVSAMMELAERRFRDQKDKKGIEFPITTIERAILQVAHENEYHPVRDYLRNDIAWDGVQRLERVPHEILGIGDDQPLAPMLLRRWFVSAVARPLDPGCKVDTVLIFSGHEQGTSKSTFFKVLAGRDQFSDTPVDIRDKDAKLAMRYAWITEWAELEQLQGKSNKSVKGFVSSATDMLRAPYARGIKAYDRTGVIVGTTNEDEFLTDPTGSRRYLCLRIGSRPINLAMLSARRDQLWAEAVALFDAAQTCEDCAPMMPDKRCEAHRWWLEKDEAAALENSNADFSESDIWESPVRIYVESFQPNRDTEGWEQLLTTALILENAVSIRKENHDNILKGRIRKVMNALGWTDSKRKQVKGPDGQKHSVKYWSVKDARV